MIRRLLISSILTLVACTGIYAQKLIQYRDTLECEVYFRQEQAEYDPHFSGNEENFAGFVEKLNRQLANPKFKISRIHIVSGASPEGSLILNESLSVKRADVALSLLLNKTILNESLVDITSLGVDWDGLIDLVVQDDGMSHRDKMEFVMGIINGKGITYRRIYDNIYPKLRRSAIKIVCVLEMDGVEVLAPVSARAVVTDVPGIERPGVLKTVDGKAGFNLAFKTNAAALLGLVPNIGFELAMGQDWSLAGGWNYAWWHSDRSKWYWRTYGGDIALRRWFGDAHDAGQLTGHHLGVYGQMMTYDFLAGGKGILGDRWSYAGGLEYGYSFPLAESLNLDLSIGAGYMTGMYKEYVPADDHYVWQATANRHYWGPTKAEISLVWILGRNRGGRR